MCRLCRNEGDLTGDTLPARARPDLGVNEALTLSDDFALLRFSDAKDANSDSAIGADVLIEGFCGLVSRRFNAGEKLSFAGEAAIDVDSDEGQSEKLFERFGVLGFDRTVPGMFERDDAAGLVFRGRLSKSEIAGK